MQRVPTAVGTACGGAFSGNVNGLIQLTVPLHWVVGTTQQWNFTIQRELGRDWFMELGYVGTKGTRLRSTYDPDKARSPHRRRRSLCQDRMR